MHWIALVLTVSVAPGLAGLSRTMGEGGVIGVSRGDGAVVLLDARLSTSSSSGGEGGAAALLLRAHEKKVFCCDFNPIAPWQLATASLDRTVCLWDVRALRTDGKKMKPIAELPHGKTASTDDVATPCVLR